MYKSKKKDLYVIPVELGSLETRAQIRLVASLACGFYFAICVCLHTETFYSPVRQCLCSRRSFILSFVCYMGFAQLKR